MKKLGGVNALYPSLTTLVGAMVNGRPNFATIAHVGIMNHATPHLISVSINKSHHTNQGIEETRTFSVNLPTRAMLEKTDCMGLVSGRNADKSKLFDVFYGELETAPLIRECPVVMECRLERVIDFATHDLFVGAIVQTHVDENVLTDERIDLKKVDPLLFDFSSVMYWSLGEPLARCWHAGKELKRSLLGE